MLRRKSGNIAKKLRKNYNIQIKRNFYLQQLIDGRLTRC